MSKRKTQRNITIFFSILAVLMIAFGITSSFSLFTAVSEEKLINNLIYKQIFGNIRCVNTFTTTSDGRESRDLADGIVQKFYCDGINSNLLGDRSQINIKVDRGFFTLSPRIDVKICNINDKACDNPELIKQNYGGKADFDVASKDLVEVVKFDCLKQFARVSGRQPLPFGNLPKDRVFVIQEFAPYQLIDENSGSYLSKLSENCALSEFKDVIEKRDFRDRLLPGEFRNYVSDIVLAPSDGNIYNYQGKEVICAGNNVYPLTEKKEFADGDIVRFANMLNPTSVECCPSMPGCTKEFKKDTSFIQPGKECGKLKGVATGFFPSTEKEGYVCKIACKDNKQTETNCKIDECSKDCDEGFYCNNDRECVEITQPKSGDCPKGTHKQEREIIKGIFGQEKETISECVKDEFNLLIPLLIALGGLLIATILIIVRMRRRK